MLSLVFFLATLLCVNAQLSALVLPQAFADRFGAKCLDGSPPAIYYKLGDPNRVLLFLEGGGWCSDTTYNSTVANCFGRAAGGGGSSNGIHNGSSMDVGGIMSTNPAVNPYFYNATLVFHHYCDGSSYSSYRPDPITAPADLAEQLAELDVKYGKGWNSYNGTPASPKAVPQIWMRGRANLKAVIMYLLENLGMNSATEMILSGGSAGATGVFLGLDYVKEWLPPTIKLVGNPDAGFFLDLPRVSNGEYWYRETFAAADGVWNSSASGNVASPACLSAVGPDVYKCYLPEYSMNYIQTPLLASNSALDMWGILNILGLGCVPTQNNASYNGMSACNPAAWEKIQEWWGGFQQRIKAVTGAAPNARSAFIASCFVHEINVDYCSGQSLPNCRGWAKYKVAPSSPSAPGLPVTLSNASVVWFNNAMANYPSLLKEGKEAVQRALQGKFGPASGGGSPTQWVDTFTYPMNPSCYFPPG